MNSQTDQIAREAARLISTKRVEGVEPAIRAAIDALDAHDAPPPSHARVRQHAQAMSMQLLGDAEYVANRRNIWIIAEELMSSLEFAMPDAASMLAGRAAAGHFDADPHLHLRLHTDAPIGEIARHIVEHEYEEPRFVTAETRLGRMDQLQFTEQGIPITITRCPTAVGHQDRASASTDLFTGRPIEAISLQELRRSLRSATSDSP